MSERKCRLRNPHLAKDDPVTIVKTYELENLDGFLEGRLAL